MAFSMQSHYRHNARWLSAVFALLVIVQVLVFSLLHLRHDVKNELGLQAALLATSMHEDGIEQRILDRAALNRDLVLACAYDGNGKPLLAARGDLYSRFTDRDHFEGPPLEQCDRFHAGLVNDFLLIDNNALIAHPTLPRSMGSVALISAHDAVFVHYGWTIGIFGISIFAFSFLCWWIGMDMHRSMLRPIRQIATTAQRVSLYKDYSLRVRPGPLRDYPAEIELLIESFNAMLTEIEDRDARLMRKTVETDKARSAAEAANVAKSQFLANISHELRTPLNAIIGFSTMLQSARFSSDPKKSAEYARDIHDSGRHLLDVINDILDLSNAESGKLAVRFEQLQLTKLIEKTMNIAAAQAAERLITIEQDIPDKLPKIIGDRVRLVQVLLNILSNAIKFSNPNGTVQLRVRAEEGRAGVTYFTIEVEDHGIGMTPEEIGQAFTTFNQSDAGLNRKYEGAGLGLALARRLVELHHGRIILESTKGLGTKVTIRLVSDPALLD